MARRRSGKKIDFVHWTFSATAQTAVAVGTSGVTMSSAQHDPETLLRIRGNMASVFDGLPAPGAHTRVGVGLILVPEGTGSTVLWAPITDGDAPWIWFESFDLLYEEPVVDVVGITEVASYRSVINNKAMRIVRNQELQFVVENASISGGNAINVGLNIRVLSGT